MPPVLLTPVANLPPVSLIPAAIFPPVSTTQAEMVKKFATGVVDAGGKFATGVVDTGGAPNLQISPQIFEKNQNYPCVIFRGLEEGDSCKSLKQKIS